VFLAGISFDVSFDTLYPHGMCLNPTSNPFFKWSLNILPKVWGGPSLKSSIICVYLAGIDLCHYLIIYGVFSLFVIHIFPKVLMNNVITYNMICISVVYVSNLLL
jgi:hypothetical protein